MLPVIRCRPGWSHGPGVSVPWRAAEHQQHTGFTGAPTESGQSLQHRGAAGRRWLRGPVSREGACAKVPAHTHEHRKCPCLWVLFGSHKGFQIFETHICSPALDWIKLKYSSIWVEKKVTERSKKHRQTHTPTHTMNEDSIPLLHVKGLLAISHR